MAIKPILDIDIDPDDKLGAYVKKYKEYESALKKTPGMWAAAGAEAQETVTSFEAGIAALLAMLAAAEKVTDQSKKQKKNADDTGTSWKKAAVWSRNFASNVYNATVSMAKWVGIGTALTGLAGAGGLWGLDKLAGAVGAGRRSSQGLGLSYGSQRAFEVDFGRLVDPGSFLGGVNESLSDVTKRRFLYAGGLSGSQLTGKDTGQVSIALLQSIKQLADNTNPEMLGQLLSARGLGQFGLGIEDLRRLRATPQSELGGFLKQFSKDKTAFGFDDAVQKKWQDLSRTLESSKNKIESAFIVGLTPLAPQLGLLSDAAAEAIRTFLQSKDLKGDIKDFAEGVKNFAHYLTSPQFKSDVKQFAHDLSALVHAIHSGLQMLGIVPYDTTPWKDSDLNPDSKNYAYGMGGAKEEKGDALVHNIKGWLGLGPGRNNPGNLRNWTGIGFQNFGTMDEGLRAMGNQLKRYEYSNKFGHLDTISKIIATYAPAKDHNDVAAYIKDVVTRSGFGANQHLDLNNPAVLARLMSAMVKHENKKNNIAPQAIVKVLNNTGGSAVVNASRLPQ